MRNTVRELYPAPYPIWEVLLLDKKYLGTNSANRLIKKIGNLLNLTTNNKDDIVSAINEIAEKNTIPSPTSEDEGKFLRVVNEEASWVSVPNAEEAIF